MNGGQGREDSDSTVGAAVRQLRHFAPGLADSFDGSAAVGNAVAGEFPC